MSAWLVVWVVTLVAWGLSVRAGRRDIGVARSERDAARASLAALHANYEAMFESRYQAGYEAGVVQGMAEQREIQRAAHSVRGQKAAETRRRNAGSETGEAREAA